jgi:DNA-binding protein H-NS
MSDAPNSDKKPRDPVSPWLEWIQKRERAIGEPAEQFLRSDTYFDLMTQMKRARAQVTRKVEGAWEEWLHLFNLPAATDIRRLREQLSRLERQVNRIAKDLADREEAAQEQPPPKRAAAKRSPRPKPKPNASEPDGS